MQSRCLVRQSSEIHRFNNLIIKFNNFFNNYEVGYSHRSSDLMTLWSHDLITVFTSVLEILKLPDSQFNVCDVVVDEKHKIFPGHVNKDFISYFEQRDSVTETQY